MGRADVGDHRQIGAGTAAESLDFTQAPHAHLHHHGRLVRGRLQQGEGHADVVVLIAAGGPHFPEGGQGRANQFPGGGFAGRAGHRHHRSRELAPPEASQLLVGQQGVWHQPEGHGARQGAYGSGRQLLRLGQQGDGTGLEGGGEEGMAVKTLAHQGHKQLAGS